MMDNDLLICELQHEIDLLKEELDQSRKYIEELVNLKYPKDRSERSEHENK